MADELYIGYEPQMPDGIAVHVRRVVSIAVVLVLALALGTVWWHTRLTPSRFDFGRPQRVDGLLTREPYPALDVGADRMWLVAPGKHGADHLLADVPNGPVSLDGATIARGQHSMLEVVPGSVVPRASQAPAHEPTASSPEEDVVPPQFATLAGEIVDSKCFLGVMNPGEGTVHRDCARMCLRGGIPPMLLMRGPAGEDALVLLVAADGGAIGRELAHLAGQSVTVRGRLERRDALPVLFADVAAYHRAPAH